MDAAAWLCCFILSAVHFIRCVHAECFLVTPRLTRTGFGIALLLLGLTLGWLGRRGVDPVVISLLAGALGAVIGAVCVAGDTHDRAAVAIALTHPTAPLAIATGRWLVAVLPAALLSLLWASAGGILAAMAVGGLALLVTVLAGRGGAAVLFLFIAVAGAVEPERLVSLATPGAVRLAAASALELGPALWHYRDAARGDFGAILHALAWALLGVLLASGVIKRWRVA